MPEPAPDTQDAFVIFRVGFVLPAGCCAILVQIQTDRQARDDETLDVRVSELGTGRVYQRVCVALAQCEPSHLDSLILVAEVPYAAPAEIVAVTKMSPASIRLRHLKVLKTKTNVVSIETFQDNSATFRTQSLKAIFVGSTNLCNANCPHCPTNKKMTSHFDRGVMSMAVFEKLVLGLDGVEIADSLVFGVFGEPFDDPFLEERIKLVKTHRPELNIDIASNGALAAPERVAKIINDIRQISVHIEAVTPSLYNKLMVPLKSDIVFPRVSQLIDLFGSKITVTTPLHQANVHEVPGLRRRWSHHGTEVSFLPLQTRATDQTLAKRINLGPSGGYWGTDLLDILVVDWDGTVLTTCDDFLRRQPLGDLNSATVPEILSGEPRRAVFDRLRGYRWSALPSLTDAVVDELHVTQRFAAIGLDADHWVIHAHQLRCGPDARKTEGGIALGPPPASPYDTPVVFGPYLQLMPGRYHAIFSGQMHETSNSPRILFEVAADFGIRRYAAVERAGNELDRFQVSVEFFHNFHEQVIEFRVFGLAGETSAVTLQDIRLTRLVS